MKKKSYLYLLLLVLIIYLMMWVLIPAYYSTKIGCSVGIIDNYENNPPVSGALVVENGSIKLYINPSLSSEQYEKTLKHEWIHYVQYKDNRSFDCDSIFGVYVNEAEAYIGENYPDFIYELLYGKLLINK